jgi:hypothetical protein
MSNEYYNVFHKEFLAEVFIAYTKTLVPKIKSLVRSRNRHILPQKFKNAIFIFESREHESLEFAIYNALLQSNHDVGLIVYCTPNNLDFCKEITAPLENVVLHCLDRTVTSYQEYNSLLTEPEFWMSLYRLAKTILLTQVDALIIRPIYFELYAHLDYIGSPFVTDKVVLPFLNNSDLGQADRPFLGQKTNVSAIKQLQQPIGNGGISIRKIKTMLQITHNVPYSFEEHGNEDLYFSKILNQFPEKYTLPTTSQAALFAGEHSFQADQYCFHKTWEYITCEQFMGLLQRHCSLLFSATRR